ncbi:MAG: hypothetical protein AABZ47_05480 [Planctomycetota bacterium]
MMENVSDAREQVLSERMEAPVGDAPLPCPLCGYDLRGQSEPRCSECGYRFEWAELLDPRFREHAYLFEYQPRLIRPFWRTLVGGLRSRKFWSGLHPVQPVNRRRLTIYYLLTIGVIGSVSMVAVARLTIITAYQIVEQRSTFLANMAKFQGRSDAPPWYLSGIAQYGSHTAFANALFPDSTLKSVFQRMGGFWKSRDWMMILELHVGVAIWPILTMLALQVFRWSMRKARIGGQHILRSTIYSFDAVVWVFVPWAIAVAFWPFWIFAGGSVQPVIRWALFIVVIIVLYRLALSYKLYLRFHRPIATVVSSQIIVALLYLTAMQVYGCWAGRWLWK